MANYKNERLGTSFTVSDSLTVREQLRYKQAIALSVVRPDLYERHWDGVKAVARDWKCDILPDMSELNFDTMTNPRMTEIVYWACNEVAGHMNDLEEVPKNS